MGGGREGAQHMEKKQHIIPANHNAPNCLISDGSTIQQQTLMLVSYNCSTSWHVRFTYNYPPDLQPGTGSSSLPGCFCSSWLLCSKSNLLYVLELWTTKSKPIKANDVQQADLAITFYSNTVLTASVTIFKLIKVLITKITII